MERPDFSQVKIFLFLKELFPDFNNLELEEASYRINQAIINYYGDFYFYNETGTKDLLRMFQRKRYEAYELIKFLTLDVETSQSHTGHSYIRQSAEEFIKDWRPTYYFDKPSQVFITNITEDLGKIIEIFDKATKIVMQNAKRGRKEEDVRVNLAIEIGTILWDLTNIKPTTSRNEALYKTVAYSFKLTRTKLENIHHILSKAIKTASEDD